MVELSKQTMAELLLSPRQKWIVSTWLRSEALREENEEEQENEEQTEY